MTAFYKIVMGGYIVGFGTNGGGEVSEITEDEYNDLTEMFATRPTAPNGYAYMIQNDPREWVLVEMPPDPDPEPTAEDKAEAYDILVGVSE